MLVAGTASLAAVVLPRDGSVELVADDRTVSCRLTETLAVPPGYAIGRVAATDRSGRYLAGGFRPACTTFAINDRGDIAGSAPDGGGRSHAIVWPAGALDQPRRLEAPGNAVAFAIGADGTVAGIARMSEDMRSKGNGQPYLWTRDGRGRQLDLPAGWGGGRAISVYDGWVLGYLYRDAPSGDPLVRDQEVAPVRWRVRGGAAQLLAEPSDLVEALGASGWLTALTVPTGWSATVLISADGRVRRTEEPSADPTRKARRASPSRCPSSASARCGRRRRETS